MGLIDDKKSIFTTIGAYTSLNQQPKLAESTNIFPSINNKKEVMPFLLDMLKVVVGSDALQGLTGELFSNFITDVEPKLKDAIKKQAIQYNAGDPLPTNFSTGSGIRVKVKDIDIYGKYKTPPSSAGGNLIYSSKVKDFDRVAYDAIQNAGTTVPFGTSLTMKYDSVTDEMVFKGTGASVGEFANGFIDDMTIIDKKSFTTNVLNRFYGTVTKSQNKTVEQAYQELYVDAVIEQLCADDGTFEITTEVAAELQKKAEELITGVVTYDLGCGLMAASLPMSGLTSVINNISGSTDPNYIGNQISSTVPQSTADNSEAAEANQQTVKDGFFQRILRYIQNEFAKATSTSPQIRVLFAIISAFQNDGVPQIGDPKEDLKKFRIFIKCNINALLKLIYEFIFNLIVRFMIALLNPVIRRIIKEKITQYSNVIKSLIKK